MLEITTIRQNPSHVIERLGAKNFDKAAQAITDILALDAQRRAVQQQLDDARNQNKTISEQIGKLYKQGNQQQANELKQQVNTINDNIRQLEANMGSIEQQLDAQLVQLPNLPHQSVPLGKHPDDNQVVKTSGTVPTLHPNAKPHWDLVTQYNLVNFEIGAKITGSGFPLYIGKGARLQRALINFFLDEAIAAGYTEYLPPHLVNEASAYATGQLPDKEGQMYHATADNLYLIPTAEVPLTNIYRDVILKQDELPVKLTGYTPCFRREAGSHGIGTRGLNRLHQFDKVEIVQIQHPDNSYQALEEMLQHVEGLLTKLGLPYRVLRLCGGDMSFTSALTYDLEVYSAAQQQWLEVSSVSNFETYQANRLKLRFRDTETKKNILAHTLNGSALALARIVASLLENNQTPNGITIPQALQKYTGFDIID